MPSQLTLIDENILPLQERKEIDNQINQVINKHKNNRYEINKLVFESVSALTESENYSIELHSQGTVKKFFSGLTGKNRELQRNIDNSLARSQYASQQTLQKLAEQNLMSFELITAVNNKLNASLIAVENEINNIYGTLVAFFKQSKSDIIQLENRVDRLERNVNLLNWQNSIEYQMFNGVEYAELDGVSKIVCLVRDFYDITKGQWTTSDLLLLKTAMATIEISPKAVGNYFEFVKSVCYNKTLSNKLFGNKLIVRQPNPEYLTMLSGINKLNLLGTKEHYVVDTVLEQVGQVSDEKTISENLTKSYIAQEANINIFFNVNHYDLMLELLYCLKQAEEEGLFDNFEDMYELERYQENDINDLDENSSSVKFERASELFRTYNPQEALPLLEELSNENCCDANVLLYWLYTDGYYINGNKYTDESKGKQYLKEGYSQGHAMCSVLYGLFVDSSNEYKIVKDNFYLVQELANNGNFYAEYILGIVAINNVFGIDYFKAVTHFSKANLISDGFYRAAYGAFLRAYNDNKPFSSTDSVYLQIWATEIMKYKCPKHLIDVAFMYRSYFNYGFNYTETEEDRELDNIKNEYYKTAVSLFTELLFTGDVKVYTGLGLLVWQGFGIKSNPQKACELLTFAAEKGYVDAEFELGQYYSHRDKEQAKYWYNKAIEHGHKEAQGWLNMMLYGTGKLSDVLTFLV